jgi:hypothetical protein
MAEGHQIMSTHVSITPEEAADRLAIRELVEAFHGLARRLDRFVFFLHLVFFATYQGPGGILLLQGLVLSPATYVARL